MPSQTSSWLRSANRARSQLSSAAATSKLDPPTATTTTTTTTSYSERGDLLREGRISQVLQFILELGYCDLTCFLEDDHVEYLKREQIKEIEGTHCFEGATMQVRKALWEPLHPRSREEDSEEDTSEDLVKDSSRIAWHSDNQIEVACKRIHRKYYPTSNSRDTSSTAKSGWRNILKDILFDVQVMSHYPLSQHRNIVPLLGIFFEDEKGPVSARSRNYFSPVMVVPWAFSDLNNFFGNLPSEQVFTWENAASLISDVADGLQVLHLYKIVHGDLKPGNILLFRKDPSSADDSFQYVAKLSDFGWSSSEQLEIPGGGGTESWLAPECIARADDPAVYNNASRDVFSFGLVAMFILREGSWPREDRLRLIRDTSAMPERVFELLDDCRLRSSPNFVFETWLVLLQSSIVEISRRKKVYTLGMVRSQLLGSDPFHEQKERYLRSLLPFRGSKGFDRGHHSVSQILKSAPPIQTLEPLLYNLPKRIALQVHRDLYCSPWPRVTLSAPTVFWLLIVSCIKYGVPAGLRVALRSTRRCKWTDWLPKPRYEHYTMDEIVSLSRMSPYYRRVNGTLAWFLMKCTMACHFLLLGRALNRSSWKSGWTSWWSSRETLPGDQPIPKLSTIPPLRKYIDEDDLEGLRRRLQEHPEDLRDYFDQGETIAHYAASRPNSEALEVLIGFDAEVVHWKSQDEVVPLASAVIAASVPCVKLLIGSDFQYKEEDLHYVTMYMYLSNICRDWGAWMWRGQFRIAWILQIFEISLNYAGSLSDASIERSQAQALSDSIEVIELVRSRWGVGSFELANFIWFAKVKLDVITAISRMVFCPYFPIPFFFRKRKRARWIRLNRNLGRELFWVCELLANGIFPAPWSYLIKVIPERIVGTFFFLVVEEDSERHRENLPKLRQALQDPGMEGYALLQKYRQEALNDGLSMWYREIVQAWEDLRQQNGRFAAGFEPTERLRQVHPFTNWFYYVLLLASFTPILS